MTKHFVLGAVCLFGVLSAGAASAQSIDYGSLESLFGEPVTTSATGTPKRVKDVPTDMVILTADDIRRSGSRNIPEILRQVPGLDVMQSSTRSFDVGVRGYNQGFQPRLLVLLNGRQVFLDDYSRTDWNAIPVNIDDIRQIEVVKGPNAALFGTNAVGGVVNIITYNPFYDKVNIANVTTGSQHDRESSATATQKLGSWGGIKVSAGALNNDEFDTPRGPVDKSLSVNPTRRFAALDGVFQLAPGFQGELESTYVKSQASGAGFSGLYTESSQEISSLKGMLADETDYGVLKATSYWNHIRTGFMLPNPGSFLVNDLFVTQLEDQFRAGANHTFRIATEYRDNRFDLTANQAVPQHPLIGYTTWSGSGMWNWQMLKDVSFTNALRVDTRHESQSGTLWPGGTYTHSDYDHSLTGISANSGMVWEATNIDTFRLTYGRGLQFPSFDDSGVAIAAPLGGPAIINIQNNPKLQPTVGTNYEADYDRQIQSLFSTVRSSVFYTENRDIKSFVNIPPAFPIVVNITTANIGSSHAEGFELGLKGERDGFRWGASYSLAQVTDDPAVKTLLHYEKSAPQNSVKLNLGYSVNQWELDGFGYYLSAREALREPDGVLPTQVVKTGGYSSVSARIGYKINDNLTLALSGTGLNREQFDASAWPRIERQVFLGLTGKF